MSEQNVSRETFCQESLIGKNLPIKEEGKSLKVNYAEGSPEGRRREGQSSLSQEAHPEGGNACMLGVFFARPIMAVIDFRGQSMSDSVKCMPISSAWENRMR